MSARRARRVLLVAIALSLLFHLVVALNVHPLVGTEPEQTEKVSIIHRSSALVLKATPPPPPRKLVTPKPVVTRTVATPAARPREAKPQGNGQRAPIRSGGAPKATAAATPAPAASAVATTCAHTDVAASLAETPPPPDIAPAVRAQGTSGTAIINVQLDEQGNIIGTAVSQSTGNSSLDLVAVSMARAARYAPASHDCKPAAGTYAFSVKFVAW